jgi:hypothetical protein
MITILIIICIIGIIILLITYINKRIELFDTSDILLVISRYNEDLKWLNDEPFNKYKNIIYNKGPNNNFIINENTKEIKKLPNIGRCDHTYLHYVIENYNNLPNIVVFLPGSVNMDFKYDKASRLLEELDKSNKNIFIGYKHNDVKKELYDFELDKWEASDNANKAINNENKLELSSIRPFGKWFEHHFGDTVIKYVTYSGILSVDKKTILRRPITFYQNLIKDVSNSSNPEAGHYIERSWLAIFNPEDENDYIYI